MGGEVSAGAGLASALFGVIWNAMAVIGCVIAVIALAVALLSLCWHLRRRRALRTPTQPNPVLDAFPPDRCPWCHTRECLDRTLCNCEQPCGSWICVIKEANK